MDSNAKIFVGGHKGLVGSAIVRSLERRGFQHIIIRSHQELDLTRQKMVEDFFEEQKFDYVFLAAAKVGGIYANNTYPADFLYQNLMIQNNVIHSSYINKVKKILFMGSSCIYPKLAPQPMREEYLLTGPLEPTNEAYGVAKIAGLKQCAFYNKQYGTNYIGVMPTNVYGPNDNYHLQNSHALPALIRKIHEAKIMNKSTVEIWGSGKPMREFIYSDDLADACVLLMQNYNASDIGEFINIGVGKDMSMAEIAQLIAEIIGYTGQFYFDTTREDGTLRKTLDVSKLFALGWQPQYTLRQGLQLTYQDYLTNNVRKE